jgi:hypothetical protein
MSRLFATRGLLTVLGLLAGCTHLHAPHPSSWHPHLPWQRAPAAAEAAVNELVVEAAAGAVAPKLEQSWNRNTLRISLAVLAGEGELTLRPLQGHDWPIRMEFLVQPGSFAHLEVRGEQRVILSVAASGGVHTLAVPQGTYAPATRELVIHYGP